MSSNEILNANRIIEEDLKDHATYIVEFNAKGEFLKEVMKLISGEDKVLAHTIAKCLSFYRMCKEIEDKGGELRFKWFDDKTYKMKLPK